MAHLFTNGILNSFSDTDPNTEITSNIFPLLNPAELDTSIWNIHSIMGFSQDCNFFTNNASEINTSTTLSTNITPIEEKSVVPSSTVSAAVNDRSYHARNKRKSLETPENSSANSSPQDSEYGITNKNSAGKVIKKQKCNKQNEEKPRDVVHVRARRGQATDSHSLAERVRRGKINERLRCLQDIVPGCHKTVGMAAMLDEIINYVQSLQNQVEFLSMKLTAASNFHDFNTETDTMNLMIQKLLRERFELGDEGFGLPLTQHGPPFDLSFGCYHSLPNNK